MPTSNSVLKTNSDPLITIAIPTFNRALWLQNCILAALSQTYGRLEVFVSDNASTDNTAEVLASFHDQRLRIIRQETNIGLLPNWNACLAGARGDYIVFVSDDDMIAPDMLERCIALLRSNRQIPLVIALSDTYLIEEQESRHSTPSRVLKTGIWDGTDILLEYLKDRIYPAMCSILIRTDALRKRGGFPADLPHAGDAAGWAPLLLNGKSGFVNESCATNVVHNSRETSNLKIEQLLIDGFRVADLISDMASSSIDDRRKRYDVQIECRRCFARRAILIFSYYRRGGGKLVGVIPLVWKYRRHLSRVGLVDFIRLAKPIAVILLPKQITYWVRRHYRMNIEQMRNRESAPMKQ